VILFRPVGLDELRLVYESRMRAFPPRLPGQPIFYPVLNEEYARQIAREWNTKSDAFAGFVTRFEVDDVYAGNFERHIVGSRVHEELWVPAEDLSEFNRRVVGQIQVVAAFFGEGYRGFVPDRFGSAGKDAVSQFRTLAVVLDHSGMDFMCETAANHVAVFLNYFFWEQHDFAATGPDASQRERLLAALRERWTISEHAGMPLGVQRLQAS
jgi:hypothetical protein